MILTRKDSDPWTRVRVDSDPWETGPSRSVSRLVESLGDVCQKIKPDRRGKAGHLHPLRIPLLPFDVVTLDLITGLLCSEECDAVLVVINKLTKFATYLPYKGYY